MLAFDEAYPISLLQRKLRIGYNTAQRLLNLVKEQRSLLSQDLPRVLKKAWHHAMDRYSAGKVNSERTLHAILYSQLVAALPDCTVLCEPQLSIDQHGVFVPDVVVINQPTWGVDAAAAAAIRQAILDRAAEGAAVVVISQDLDELLEISDRFAVLNGGRLTAPRPVQGLTVEEIGLMMGGAHGMEVAHHG